MTYKTSDFEIRTTSTPKVDFRRAFNEALELTGGLIFWGYALHKAYGNNIFLLVASFALVWAVYETNKISN